MFRFLAVSSLFVWVHFLKNVEADNKVLIISFDGFRWDYVRNQALKNLTSFHRMIADGGWAMNGMRNTFITKTYPNHYALVTGLYEESHGVVGNAMYDPIFNETFSPWNKTTDEDARWYNGEPIWVTNQKQNTGHRSGSVMWPASRASIQGFRPYRVLPYIADMPYNDRVDTIVDWFTDTYPINLGLLYFPEPDHIAHQFGPESPEVLKKISELDQVLERLFYKLEDNKLLNQIDILVTSDHGMTNIPADESYKIDLNKYISFDSYFVTSSNPVAAIFPKSKDLEEEIYKNLTGIPHTHVYLKADIPDSYHFKHNRRTPPIILEPEEHYWVSYNDSKRVAGQHGYNNRLKSMHPVFIAMGPSFKKGEKVEMFDNVDVYPLMCKLLNLKPAPNNGSLEVVNKLLVNRLVTDTSSTFGQYILILILVSLVSGIFSVAACQVHRHYRRRQVKLRTLTGFPKQRNYRGSKEDFVPLMSDSSEEEFNLP